MSESGSLKRTNFFNGRLLTASDLQLEQQYHRGKSQLHNRSLHGFGIVSGLKVMTAAGQILIEPGLALDCEGNELIVDVAQSVVTPPITGDSLGLFLTIRYAEVGVDLIAVGKQQQPAAIVESFEFGFVKENSNRGHRHLRARWLACGQPHPLTIAKLRRSNHGWRVERGYRPPQVK